MHSRTEIEDPIAEEVVGFVVKLQKNKAKTGPKVSPPCEIAPVIIGVASKDAEGSKIKSPVQSRILLDSQWRYEARYASHTILQFV